MRQRWGQMTRTSLLRGARKGTNQWARGDLIHQTGEAVTLQEILHSTLFRIRERLSHSGKSCQELASTIQGSWRRAARFLGQQRDWVNIFEFLHVAAVHLHEVQDQIQRVLRNMDVEQIQQMFAKTQNQIADLHQKDLYVMNGQQSWKERPPKSCTPLHKDIYKQCTAKVYVFSDSVLCRGGKCNILNQQELVWQTDSATSSQLQSTENWTTSPENLSCSSGRFSQGPRQRSFSKRSKSWWRMGSRSTRRTSRTVSYSCRCTTTCMVWTAKNNATMCDENASRVSDNAKKFPMGYWTFLGPEDENRWYGTLTYELNGDWDWTAEIMMLIFAESGHTLFRGTSLLYRRSLKSGGGENVSMHFNAQPHAAQLLFRTTIAVTQRSIYGWPVGATTKFFQQRNPTLNTKLQQEFLQNSYHASPNTKLWTLEPRKTWRRNVMKNSRTWQKCVKTPDSHCETVLHDQVNGHAENGWRHEFMPRMHSSSRGCWKLPERSDWERQLRREWAPGVPRNQSFGKRIIEKGEGAVKVSIHFNAEPQTARIVIPHSAWRQSAQDLRSSGIWV